MDARLNPYTPGNGVKPALLAGRGNVVRSIDLLMARSSQGKLERNPLLVGLRGSGKTVLLDHIRREAESRGMQVIAVAAGGHRSLPALLLPDLRALLVRLSQRHQLPGRQLEHAAAMLAGFSADSSDLELDLAELFGVFAALVQANGGVLWLLVDDLQHLDHGALLTLLAALARVRQRELPMTMLAAALPTIGDGLSRSGPVAERLLSRYELDALSEADSARLLIAPAALMGVKFASSALTTLIREGAGNPYVLQQLGHAVWDVATTSPVRLEIAHAAIPTAMAELDAGFMRQRFERLAPQEKRYLRAMAELGAGVHRSGMIAGRLGRRVTALAPTRSNLIAKGLVYSPRYGETSFTTPLYDGFLLRTLPELS
jgi:hypothetical protein